MYFVWGRFRWQWSVGQIWVCHSSRLGHLLWPLVSICTACELHTFSVFPGLFWGRCHTATSSQKSQGGMERWSGAYIKRLLFQIQFKLYLDISSNFSSVESFAHNMLSGFSGFCWLPDFCYRSLRNNHQFNCVRVCCYVFKDNNILYWGFAWFHHVSSVHSQHIMRCH